MIALLALSLATVKPQIIELPDPAANRIAVQVLVKLPELDAREMAMAQVLESVLLRGTENYSRRALLNMSSRVGAPIKCLLTPDHFRIQFSISSLDLSNTSLIVDNILRRSNLDDEVLKETLETLPFRVLPYWTEALDFRKPRFDRIKRTEIVEFYHHVFRPENVTIGISGPFDAGKADAAIQQALSDWQPGRDRYPRTHSADMPVWAEIRKRPVTTLELYTEVPTKDFSSQLVLASVMGLGKGSLIFQVVREQMGLSYRQEAFLWPSPTGMELRLIIALPDNPNAKEIAGQVKTALLKAIDGLEDMDLRRARALLSASWKDGILPGPIQLGAARALGNSLEDRVLLAAYGAMKTGAPWLYDTLLDDVDKVTLESAKATAKTAIESSKVRIITGG